MKTEDQPDRMEIGKTWGYDKNEKLQYLPDLMTGYDRYRVNGARNRARVGAYVFEFEYDKLAYDAPMNVARRVRKFLRDCRISAPLYVSARRLAKTSKLGLTIGNTMLVTVKIINSAQLELAWELEQDALTGANGAHDEAIVD